MFRTGFSPLFVYPFFVSYFPPRFASLKIASLPLREEKIPYICQLLPHSITFVWISRVVVIYCWLSECVMCGTRVGGGTTTTSSSLPPSLLCFLFQRSSPPQPYRYYHYILWRGFLSPSPAATQMEEVSVAVIVQYFCPTQTWRIVYNIDRMFPIWLKFNTSTLRNEISCAVLIRLVGLSHTSEKSTDSGKFYSESWKCPESWVWSGLAVDHCSSQWHNASWSSTANGSRVCCCHRPRRDWNRFSVRLDEIHPADIDFPIAI